jgi:ubiquinone/menaquinone biosynthesis C-methylase UbiE
MGAHVLAPARSMAVEVLDSGDADPRLLPANLRDMARAHRWMGGERAVLLRVAGWLRSLPRDHTPHILDLATGGAALPLQLHRWGAQTQRALRLVASDLNRDVLRVAQRAIGDRPIALLRHDARALPFASNSLDIVICAQTLHHFGEGGARALLRECARVARLGVIISDLRRSYLAYWGARALALVTASPLSRHDGPLSVLRAYTPREVARLIEQADLPARVCASSLRIDIELQPTDLPA